MEELKRLIKNYSKEINELSAKDLYVYLKQNEETLLVGNFFVLYGVSKGLKFAETKDNQGGYNFYLLLDDLHPLRLFTHTYDSVKDYWMDDTDLPFEVNHKMVESLVPYPEGVPEIFV